MATFSGKAVNGSAPTSPRRSPTGRRRATSHSPISFSPVLEAAEQYARVLPIARCPDDHAVRANLDVDDVTRFDAEAMTITRLARGQYSYFVHNFSETFSPGPDELAGQP